MNINVAKIRLEELGYNNVTVQEAELFARAGYKDFYRVIDLGFREAYWTCRFLNICAGDVEFKPIFKRHRESNVQSALQLYREGKQDYLELLCLDDKELVKMIQTTLPLEAQMSFGEVYKHLNTTTE